MSMGMTYDQYWYGDCRIFDTFLEAHRLRKERTDEQLWLQGMYFYDALSTIVSQAFNKHSTAEYPKEPYLLKQRREQLEKEKMEAQEAAYARAYMLSMMRVGQNWSKKAGA